MLDGIQQRVGSTAGGEGDPGRPFPGKTPVATLEVQEFVSARDEVELHSQRSRLLRFGGGLWEERESEAQLLLNKCSGKVRFPLGQE